jgi:D-glycero-D-manno-heptose 1,7-bisphosphate phosphatase
MNKAIFLDRDGVINKMNFNLKTKEYEPPFKKKDVQIYEGVLESLQKLQDNKFKLFGISNQPDYAKGKTSFESLKEVHNELHKILVENNIYFTEYFYCYHHPNGVIPEFSKDCDCRKPKNYFVMKAIADYDIDKRKSWFIGDRDKDVECGISSGLRTIRIQSNYYEYKNNIDADFITADLKEASEIILQNK